MKRVLNIFETGKGGLENLSQSISKILENHFEVRSIPLSFGIRNIWKSAMSSEIILVHRTKSILKILPIKLFSQSKVLIFFHHFMARRKKKDIYHRIVYSKVDKLVVLSKRIREQVKNNWSIDESKIYIAYPGVDINRFRRSESIRKSIRERYGISKKEKVFGVIGRICEEKNQEILLEAIRKSDVDAIALIAGPVESERYFQKINMLSDKVRSILVPNFVDDVVGLLNAIDFLVITSRNEPFGLIGLEAMACSTPVLAPDNSGIAEIISDGFDSFVYSANDVKSLEERIRKAVSEVDNSNISERARKKVEKDFSLDSYGRKLKEIIMG